MLRFDYENKRSYILSKEMQNREKNEDVLTKTFLVIIHLYYDDSYQKYEHYIRSIPSYMDILFTVSSAEMKTNIEEKYKSLNNRFKIFIKENRGRDISAFLVAARKEILKYDYICFAHDKKEKKEEFEEEVDLWLDTLWENILGSTTYIENIAKLFCDKPEIGLLLPPLSIYNKKMMSIYGNTWGSNYDNLCKLLDEIGVSYFPTPREQILSVGTFFWAKVDALNKLLKKGWSYEDFPQEPLENDGTISHAIERSFAFIARDAGYTVGIVMNDEHAEERFLFNEDVLHTVFSFIRTEYGIVRYEQVEEYERIKEDALNFSNKRKIYIYGTGIIGQRCYKNLEHMKIPIEGFIVTNKQGCDDIVCGLKVYEIGEINLMNEVGVIIAGNEKNRAEMYSEIKKRDSKYSNIMIWN